MAGSYGEFAVMSSFILELSLWMRVGKWIMVLSIDM